MSEGGDVVQRHLQALDMECCMHVRVSELQPTRLQLSLIRQFAVFVA
jgi:hypothetical protein